MTQATSREELLTQTFVTLADSLVDDFDIIELLTFLASRCVELVGADAVGILLADGNGNLRVMAASSERARLLELFQLQNEEGPCLDAYRSGQPVVYAGLGSAAQRWPQFSSEAVDAGFASVYALPLRLRSAIIGALNLFRSSSEDMPVADVRLAQALADVASIAILQDESSRESLAQAGRLQHALDSRVSIEQAKGMLAESVRIEMDEAFDLLRSYARNKNRQLTAVARDLIGGSLRPSDFASVTKNAAGPAPVTPRPQV